MKLNRILTITQESAGLTLQEDEDLVYLYYGSRPVAVWSAYSVTQKEIQLSAQAILDSWRKWDKVSSYYRHKLVRQDGRRSRMAGG